MVFNMEKKKLTLSIDGDVIEAVKKKANEKGLSLSKLVENFFRFYLNPNVYCFVCGEKFGVEHSKVCPKCGWYICPHCGSCGCKLDENSRKVAFQMRRVYEDLLLGKVG